MNSPVEIIDLSPSLGVEVRGVDLTGPLDDLVAEQLRDAFRRRLVVLFRDQSLSPDDHARAVGIFGPVLDEFRDGKLASMVSNIDRDVYIGGESDDMTLKYHSDLTSTDSPPWGLSLYAMNVDGGAPGTRFVNCQLAFRTLPDPLREQLEGLDAVDAYDSDVPEVDSIREASQRVTGRVSHPLIIEHPRNGERQIYGNELWTHRVVGMERAQAKALLAEMFNHLYRPDHIYQHKWRNGDLVIWDNIALQHGRDPIPRAVARRLRRVAIGIGSAGQAAASVGYREYAVTHLSDRLET
jgi:alpha-ketoglutarate-dependent taurine dioxygenase